MRSRAFPLVDPDPATWAEERGPGVVLEILLVVLVGCVGVALFHRATLMSRLDTVQADLGDSRLVIFLLDHWTRVFAGTREWSSPAMFYPVAGTLGYADMLLGTALPYAAFRCLGLGLFEAANASLMVLSFLSYLSAYWLLRRVVRVRPLAAAAGALLFAFAYPKFSELPHLQLRFDFFQPLALGVIAPLWLDERPLRPVEVAVRTNAFVALSCLGAMTTFYNAWFLIFWVAGTGLALFLFPSSRSKTIERLREGWKVLWQPVFLGAVMAIPFFALYLPARHSGMGRSFGLTIVPSLSDYLRTGPNHFLWGWAPFNSSATAIKTPLGFGFSATLMLLAAWAWSLWRLIRSLRRKARLTGGARGDLLAASLLTALAITLVTVRWGTFVPWKAVYTLVPGASAMLAVSRWVITLMLPVCIGLSLLLEGALRRSQRHPTIARCVSAAVLLMLVEQGGRIDARYSSAVAAEYHQNVAGAIPDSCPAFLLVPAVPAGMIRRSQFDAARYLAANPDVARNWPGSAWEHYRRFGFREGRKAFSLPTTDDGLIRRESFDDAMYLAANPDVASSWHGTPWEHYRQFGFREGRSMNPTDAAEMREENFHYQLSALIASAISGKPTVNGASGLLPSGYPLSNVLDLDIEQKLSAWLAKYPGKRACLVRMALPAQDLFDLMAKRMG